MVLLFLAFDGRGLPAGEGLVHLPPAADPFIIFQLIEFTASSERPTMNWHSLWNRFTTAIFLAISTSNTLRWKCNSFARIQRDQQYFQVSSARKRNTVPVPAKILELVDTGILSYDEETGDVVDERVPQTDAAAPYLKTIGSLSQTG